MELLPVCIQETSSVFPPTFPQKTMTVAVVLCAGGRGGQGVQRGWLCEGGYRAPYGHDCPRVRPEDKPHVTWHPAGDPDQGGEKPGPHFGQGQGPETDHWADLFCTVSTHIQIHSLVKPKIGLGTWKVWPVDWCVPILLQCMGWSEWFTENWFSSFSAMVTC